MIERSWVPAGAVGNFFILQGQLSVLTICSTPVLPQQHVKDPDHSAKSVGGRLQLNTHAPYVCGFA